MKFNVKSVGYILAVAAIVNLVGIIHAQVAERKYHPGQSIEVTITFDGPDADKITTAQINMSVPAPADQHDFKTDIYPGTSTRTAPGKFLVTYQIPQSQATGDYTLSEIRAILDVGKDAPITIIYHAPSDFQAKTYKIDNPNKITKPTITSVK